MKIIKEMLEHSDLLVKWNNEINIGPMNLVDKISKSIENEYNKTISKVEDLVRLVLNGYQVLAERIDDSKSMMNNNSQIILQEFQAINEKQFKDSRKY
jgi:hypothetical protein